MAQAPLEAGAHVEHRMGQASIRELRAYLDGDVVLRWAYLFFRAFCRP
jgi:hypothetical protein